MYFLIVLSNRKQFSLDCDRKCRNIERNARFQLRVDAFVPGKDSQS